MLTRASHAQPRFACAAGSNPPLVVLNSIRLQEIDELVTKRNLSVMLLLFRNVVPHFLYV
jgi:hypothetical protein